MVAIDFIGLLITILLIGLRYPHYVLMAALVHELGKILMIMFVHGHIDTIIAAGAFGNTVVSNYNNNGILDALIVFSGPLANYIVSSTAGGVEFEKTVNLISPAASLKSPFAVINLRLAIISFLFNAWRLIFNNAM